MPGTYTRLTIRAKESLVKALLAIDGSSESAAASVLIAQRAMKAVPQNEDASSKPMDAVHA